MTSPLPRIIALLPAFEKSIRPAMTAARGMSSSCSSARTSATSVRVLPLAVACARTHTTRSLLES
jgi:hypothetical protein